MFRCSQGFDIYIYLAVHKGKLCCYDNVMFDNILKSKNQFILASPDAIRFYKLKNDSRIIQNLTSIHGNEKEKKSVLILETRMWKVKEILELYDVSICDVVHVPEECEVTHFDELDRKILDERLVLMSEGLNYYECADPSTFTPTTEYKKAIFKYDLYFQRLL